MINELYNLSLALNSVQVQTQNWHRKYKPIPNIRENAPCVCITVSGGKVTVISLVGTELGRSLRKYGSNQGSYPCMNLAPLYRITDDSVKKELADLSKHPEKIDDACICKMRTWCTENNWGRKFQGKYKICMENMPVELHPVAVQYKPLQILLDETKLFATASDLHTELERTVWEMLSRGEDTVLALTVLFYQGKKDKSADDDYGSLSVALDAAKLTDDGIPAVSEKFVFELNKCLLDMNSEPRAAGKENAVDAFDIPFQTIEEPMPNVKLAGGFDVTLRTLFKEQLCQTRYGKIENASYPISPQMRMQLQSALEWIGSSERKNTTWINTDKNEILFAYPSSLSEVPISYTALFKQSVNKDTTFSTQAKQFIQELQRTKEIGTDAHAKRITVFVLKKIDKARTKVVYTRQTDPYELEKRSEEWTLGCANLPMFSFGMPKTLYPLDVADILNRFWKQNGEIATDKFKPFFKYHGIEILMEPDLPVTADLHRLSESAMIVGAYFGNLRVKNNWSHPVWEKAKNMLALMGLFLYREHIRKDDYMDNLPYIYGQLLKTADELHVLYCRVVRGGDVPPQLVGSSLFQNAAEAPIRTLNVMSQRIMPYYSWAKSYRLKEVKEPQKESWRAGWLYRICEQTMDKLQNSWTPQTRFNDEEKAQLFIGYLAAFPKKEEREISFEEESANE